MNDLKTLNEAIKSMEIGELPENVDVLFETAYFPYVDDLQQPVIVDMQGIPEKEEPTLYPPPGDGNLSGGDQSNLNP